ncbi:MAG: hypothetical protein K5876_07230 [Ruminiclostridium sp.]|nr:hypothetical protein [Ruminiclostridium sp.]
MKNCGWYLWLNGRKIYNIRDLRENFDTAVLSGYFLGGSLMKWLSDLGENSIIKRLGSVDMNSDIGSQLEFAFGVSPDIKSAHSGEIKPQNPPTELPVKASELGIGDTAVFCFGRASSFSAYSEAASSFGAAGSFYGFAESSFYGFAESSFYGFAESSFYSIAGTESSFGLASSYAAFVSVQAVNMIQSSGSSFRRLFASSEIFGTAGSFRGFLSGSYKGFYAGSYLLSLFGGSFLISSGMYGSFLRLSGALGEGSFVYINNGITVTAEEFRRTLINLSSCPLNAYGYGINLV